MAFHVGYIFERRLVFIPYDLVWGCFQEGLHPILRPEARAILFCLVVLKIVAGLYLEKRFFRIKLLKFITEFCFQC